MKSDKKSDNNFVVLLVLLLMTFSHSSAAFAGDSFEDWLKNFSKDASSSGISQKTMDEAFKDIAPVNRVLELDKRQPENKITFAEYQKRVINDLRIRQGKKMLAQYSGPLSKVSRKYGVSPKYIVALWGIETSYGQNTGGFKVIPALATLAWDGRREKFFSSELIDALRIIDQGHVKASDMKGSWAGAMGQNQFMPSSFHKFAVDSNGDGHKDIWSTKEDVFASTANYLNMAGWKDGERWGRKVKLPGKFDEKLIGLKISKPLSEWKSLGVTKSNGKPIPVVKGMKASLVAPDGMEGETFLVYNNYKVLMDWNRSTYFATSVGLLADAISQ